MGVSQTNYVNPPGIRLRVVRPDLKSGSQPDKTTLSPGMLCSGLLAEMGDASCPAYSCHLSLFKRVSLSLLNDKLRTYNRA